MEKEEVRIWTNYDKFKSLSKKLDFILELKEFGSTDSFSRLCEEFMKNKSSVFRNEAIKIIEYLALKIDPKNENITGYSKLLKKYGISNVHNYWYRQYKEIQRENLTIEAEKFVEKMNKYSNSENHSFNCKFPITSSIVGTVQLSIAMNGGIHNLAYGFISDYRDFGGGYVNEFPFDQMHCQRKLITQSKYRLYEEIQDEINGYYKFVENHEAALLSVHDQNPLKNDYCKHFKNYFSFNSDLFFLLSLINIQKRNGYFDGMINTAQIGLKVLDAKKAGSGWIKYFEEKIKTNTT